MWIRISSYVARLLILAVSGLVLFGVTSYCLRHISRSPPVKLRNADPLRDPSNSTNPELVLAEANRLAWLSNWAKAEPVYASAEELYRRSGDRRNEVYARVGRILAETEHMRYVDASEMLSQQLEEPVTKNDAELRLWCLVAKGYVDLEINSASSKQAWIEAQRIAKTIGERRWGARATAELGIIAFLEGDNRRAAVLVGDALISAIASGDVSGQIRDLEMLGNGFYDAKRYAEAMVFFDRAISLATTTPDVGLPLMAYEGRAQVLTAQGRPEEAEGVLKKALEVANNERRLRDQVRIFFLLGEGSLQAKKRREAIEYLEQVGVLGQKCGCFKTVVQAMFDLTTLYRDLGNLQSAEKRASIGLEASKHVKGRYYLPQNLTIVADLKALRGDSSGAERLYEHAEDVIDGMLNDLGDPYWNSSLADAMSETYLHHFELCVQNGETERAVSVLERIRGRTATAALQNRTSLTNNEGPEAKALESKISQVQLQLMRTSDLSERVELKERLIENERRLWLTNNDHEETRQKSPERAASLREVQAILRPDEVLLEYVLDDPSAYSVWISHRAVGIEVLPVGRKGIEELTHRFLDQVRAKRDVAGAAQELFSVLFPPTIWDKARAKLIIVPDGALHLLPFEILRDLNGGLLVESRTISYVPSSTVLHVLRSRKSVSPTRPFLGVGDVAYQNQGSVSAKLETPDGLRNRLLRQFSDVFGMPLYDLPHTREEVLDISKFAGKDAVVLLGKEATETAFKSEPVADFKVIHLAVHGFADAQFPERSGLVLGRDPATQDDGLLQVREILRLHFNADLVTLSACDTGLGKLQGEEGITNLPEAFLASGAKAVVASLWSADDTYTVALMERFYTHIAEREEKSEALRHAKLDVLNQHGKQLLPYYWGAFVLVGDGSAPISLDAATIK